jgi:hypothetical protein
MSPSKIIIFSLLLTIHKFCEAGLSAVSPASLAEIEAGEIARLTMQNGCARPDLSDSNVDGTAVLEISFSTEGTPLNAQIISSNGSDSDNAKIIEALTKRCKYVREPFKYPIGTTKQFTYTWKAHHNLSVAGSCMIKIEYPLASVRLKEQGKAVVSFRYLANGSYESKISQSTGSERLDEKTLKNFNACLDNHALKADPDQSKWNEVSMNWKLTGNEDASSSTSEHSSSSSNTPQN